MDRVNITNKAFEAQPMPFREIPIGPFYGNFNANSTVTFLFLKGLSITFVVDDASYFSNASNLHSEVYLYRPVTLDITVKEVA